MQVQIDVKNFKLNGSQESAVNRKIKRLSRLAKMFKPDAVSVHINLVYNQPPEGFEIHLNMAVPSKKMGAVGKHAKFTLALTQVFNKVLAQFRKHRSKLRRNR